MKNPHVPLTAERKVPTYLVYFTCRHIYVYVMAGKIYKVHNYPYGYAYYTTNILYSYYNQSPDGNQHHKKAEQKALQTASQNEPVHILYCMIPYLL